MARDDCIDNAFQGGLSCTHGSEVPEHSLEGLRGHREEFVRGLTSHRPREARAPVPPGFDPGAGCAAQGAYVDRERLAHGGHRSGRGRREASQDKLEVAMSVVEWGVGGVVHI